MGGGDTRADMGGPARHSVHAVQLKVLHKAKHGFLFLFFNRL